MKRLLIVLAVLAAVTVGVTMATSASAHRAPPPPPWFGPDGQVDASKMPAWIGVGKAGSLRGYVRGPDVITGPGVAVPLYDKPNGKVIGFLDRGTPPPQLPTPGG